MKKFLFVAILFIGLAFANNAQGQKVAIKNNLLYDATGTINLGIEFGLAPKWTLNIEGMYNPFTWKDGKRWKIAGVQPELRYWTCNRFAGHFFALQGTYVLDADFSNIKLFDGKKMWEHEWKTLKEGRAKGWSWGVGLGYGYSWVLSKHWNLEFELALGVMRNYYDRYIAKPTRFGEPEYELYKREPDHKKFPATDSHVVEWYAGPTKAAISLVYVF